MKFCEKHWTELRQAIDTRGLSHLIHQGGEAAASAIERELKGIATKADYDPLMDAHNMIAAQALRVGGLYLMGADEQGNQYCPLCEVDKNISEGVAGEWITGCTDSILKHCQDTGLTIPAQ